MKLWSFILASAMAQGVLSVTSTSSACYANNCARAVTGTRTGKMPDVTSRMEDCSSFMLVTVTPAVSTISTTTTVTTTITAAPVKRHAAAMEQRQVTVEPSSIPVYAIACPNPAAYSSACSCWGIAAATTTAPTPLTTTTITVTATATVSPGTCDSPQVCEGAPSCSPNGCICQPDENGIGWCNVPQECSILTACVTASDCPIAGSVCLQTCCPGGNVCFTPAELCPNPASPKMLFKPRGIKGRDGMSGYA